MDRRESSPGESKQTTKILWIGIKGKTQTACEISSRSFTAAAPHAVDCIRFNQTQHKQRWSTVSPLEVIRIVVFPV